jgi:uncharacterized Fe-S cluster-containing radical SAM superfamily protein
VHCLVFKINCEAMRLVKRSGGEEILCKTDHRITVILYNDNSDSTVLFFSITTDGTIFFRRVLKQILVTHHQNDSQLLNECITMRKQTHSIRLPSSNVQR